MRYVWSSKLSMRTPCAPVVDRQNVSFYVFPTGHASPLRHGRPRWPFVPGRVENLAGRVRSRRLFSGQNMSKYIKICQNTHAWFRTAQKGVKGHVQVDAQVLQDIICLHPFDHLTPPCSPGSHHQIHPPHRAWSKALIYSTKCEFSGGDGQHVGLKLRNFLRIFQLGTITSVTFLPLPQPWPCYERLAKERPPAVSVKDGQS